MTLGFKSVACWSLPKDPQLDTPHGFTTCRDADIVQIWWTCVRLMHCPMRFECRKAKAWTWALLGKKPGECIYKVRYCAVPTSSFAPSRTQTAMILQWCIFECSCMCFSSRGNTISAPDSVISIYKEREQCRGHQNVLAFLLL